MPYEKDVQERKWWWCPKWYWPFAVCSGIRTQHKWCYLFSWVKETRYGFVGHLEGCENGKLYTWTRPALGFGSTYYPTGEICFDSSLGSDEGRCDASREGMLSSGLSPSDPYLSPIDEAVDTLRSDVGASGVFDFSGEQKRLCQEGPWSWNRTLHEQSIRASVTTRFAQVRWFIGGIALPSHTGTVLLGAHCTWPFPLLTGRSQHRTVTVRYTIQTTPHSSTLILYNDPADGNYGFDIGAAASDVDTGQPFAAADSTVRFRGETCDFDPAKEAELIHCIKRFRDRYHQKPVLGPPSPEPVFRIGDDIWKWVPESRVELVTALLDLMTVTARTDPAMFAEAAELLANRINVPDVSRFWSLSLADKGGNPGARGGDAGACGCRPNTAAVIAALGVGFLAWRLARSTRQRRLR
jgi:hypothetical protein